TALIFIINSLSVFIEASGDSLQEPNKRLKEMIEIATKFCVLFLLFKLNFIRFVF
ncbi:MAG: hypothetical protein ACI97X_002262, partial [Oceanospirillaceae bacterium]